MAFDRTIELDLKGLTCGHCVQHVTDELTALDGVDNVVVTLNKGGISKAVVYSDHDIADDQLREAIDEAGNYTVESISR
ncbi:MAG: heavy-metal-associated domain-containing protein [Ancrocorticia sp.]|jgi:copper chaperone CopZ|nr:heavy-metal-associated domain-containing protein [Ancrocorticia sp.]MCI1932866.1 heavy-metal-associated domain-containing protein [Ancrocorticia sp.]MCI1963757.1 heavy-metal-associated domain-containing protein [Ancrocorticia sp.]MCI2002095.1 heavy-metal-associated domain-containing protein [Ancrocorticia sp.]MCI2013483.1 heavy-metal-associated domain-containing protein [Ancrocorticia sp.]